MVVIGLQVTRVYVKGFSLQNFRIFSKIIIINCIKKMSQAIPLLQIHQVAPAKVYEG